MRRVLRWVGIGNLAVVVVMALFGAYGIRTTVSPKVFLIYWSVFFILLMGALVLAMFDALTTMVSFKKEHERLREAVTKQLREAGNLDSQPKRN
jgi:amino acid transporter